MTPREKEMQKIRKLLDPSFASMWNRDFTQQDRKWFLQCADVEKPSRTTWAEFSPDEQAAIRRAYASFMQGSRSLQFALPALV